MLNKPIPKRVQYLLLVAALLGGCLLAFEVHQSNQKSNQIGHSSDCLADSLRNNTPTNGPC